MKIYKEIEEELQEVREENKQLGISMGLEDVDTFNSDGEDYFWTLGYIRALENILLKKEIKR